MELLGKLGIDWQMLIAQLINFLILLFILHRFAYRPILDLLNERQEKINKGINDTEKAKNKLENIRDLETKILANARKQAQEIISASEKTARENNAELLTATQDKAEKILINAKKTIEVDKAKILKEVKSEVANLVLLATEKILDKKIDKERNEKIIKQFIDNDE